MSLLRRIFALFRRSKLDRDLDDELAFHVEEQTRRNVVSGMSLQEAVRAARRQFGWKDRIREEAREARGMRWAGDFALDARFALRLLRKSPGFAAVAVLTLALGIGANTTIFSIVHGVLLKPLAYHEPEQLVTLLHEGKFPVAPADFLDWRTQSESFETIAAAEAWSATLSGTDGTEVIRGIRYGKDLFDVFGVDATLGRTFAASDFEPGAPRALVISHALWQRRFGGDSGIIGRALTLSSETYTLIGVMPPKFQFAPFWAAHAEIAAPLDLAPRATWRDGNSLRVFARLKQSVSREQAQAEMDAICHRLEQAYPQTNTGRTVRIDPLLEKTVGDIRASLHLLMGAVSFVLLIACANVASLLLARSSIRRKEMATRTALGAGLSRLSRQLFTENLLLAGIGSMLGILLSYIAVEAIRTWLTSASAARRISMPRVDDIAVDLTVLGFAVDLAVFTAFLFGLAPAIQSIRASQRDALQETSRWTTGGPQGERRRSALVVIEIALSLILLTGAGLLLRSFNRLMAVDPGFDAHQALSMVVSLHGQPGMTGEKREAFYQECLQEIGTIPGVVSTSAVNHIPLAGDQWSTGLAIEGRPQQPGQRLGVVYRVCRPGYFRTMGIALNGGRDFSPQDTPTSPGVVIINEQLARAHWPDTNPVGQRITLDDLDNNPRWLTIIGVMANVRQNSWTDQPHAEVYVPFAQSPFFSDGSVHHSAMTLVIRTVIEPLSLFNHVRDAIRAVNTDAAISNVATLEQVVADALWQPRFNLLLASLFAGAAVVLAAVGLYGVMAYAVAARTREIGIRIAVGARSGQIFRLTLAQGLKLAGIGVASGLAGAFVLRDILASFLYETKPTDPLALIAGSLSLTAIVLLACWLPARRSANVDPMIALRAE